MVFGGGEKGRVNRGKMGKKPSNDGGCRAVEGCSQAAIPLTPPSSLPLYPLNNPSNNHLNSNISSGGLAEVNAAI